MLVYQRVLDIALVGIVGFHDFASQPNTQQIFQQIFTSEPQFAELPPRCIAHHERIAAPAPAPEIHMILGVDLKKKRFRLVNS